MENKKRADFLLNLFYFKTQKDFIYKHIQRHFSKIKLKYFVRIDQTTICFKVKFIFDKRKN